MSNLSDTIYRFGIFELNRSERILADGEKIIQLAPKVFETLLFLVENAGKVLSKEKMLDTIWEGSFVEENNLAQNISYLRKILNESPQSKFIETVPKFGYRFVGNVEIVENTVETLSFERSGARILLQNVPSGEPGEKSKNTDLISRELWLPNSAEDEFPLPIPETHYVLNGDVNIAYQIVGDGEIDIVFVMGWISHLEYFWTEPHFASFLKRLASFSRLILFDKRGTGLSDRVPVSELPTLEQRMEDVHAVMDAVGSEKAILIGVSEGGPMCSMFAATYPERTSALVMIGTYAKRLKDEDYPWGVSAEDREEFFELMRQDWGKPVGIEERAPSLAKDEDFRAWWATYLRMGASPGAAVALTKMNAEIDVRHVLPTIGVPTLVIHRRGDMCLKVEEGRFVASLIPDAKYVELEGVDHLPFVGNQTEILDEIESFCSQIRHSGELDRVLATVLNVKIDDPKHERRERGDSGWDTLLENSRKYVARQLQIFKGNEISYDESGVLATFDGPARAIRCADAITRSAARLGINVRTGLHTGECDRIEGKLGGIAVELARFVAAESEVGSIFVSRTVKDLVAGSGIRFEELGMRRFSRDESQWRLFKVLI